MANYRMTIQYDGTRYSGWQSQHATDATIQGKLETVLTRMTGQQLLLTDTVGFIRKLPHNQIGRAHV